MLLTILSLPIPRACARIIYVSSKAAGLNNGSSWADAYPDLQGALDEAHQSTPNEIWIAEGTYKPDRRTGNRLASFNVPGDTGLYGGFAGIENTLEDRDWARYRTILSGDLNGDDSGDLEPTEVNPCCVEYGDCQDEECREKLAQVQTTCPQYWVPECAYWAHEFCCDLCRPPDRCDNSDNVVRVVQAFNVVLDGLIIRSGEASFIYSAEAAGGGAYLEWADVTVRNCVFQKNAGWYSGALYHTNGTLSVSNSQFIENGGMARNGPALTVVGSVVEVIDCSFVRNKFGAIQSVASGGGTYRGCLFAGNGGISYAALDVVTGSPVVSDSVFIGNKSNQLGSAISSFEILSITNSLFIANHGNAAAFSWSGLIARNCGFIGNSRWALVNDHGYTEIANCSIINNYNERTDSAGVISGGQTNIRNSVLWGNANPEGSSEDAQLAIPDNSHVDFSIVEGWTGQYAGAGSSGINPGLRNPDGPDGVPGTEDDDIRLAPGSPGINAGDPSFVPAIGETDLDGHARVLCGQVDIGAYEFGAGDFNCDQTVDLLDLATWNDCMTGPLSPSPRPSPLNGEGVSGCEAFDFNADHNSDIDLSDFSYLQRVFVGP